MPGRALIACVTLLLGARGVVAQDALARAAFADGKEKMKAGKDSRASFRQAAEAWRQAPGGLAHSLGRALNAGNAAYLAGDVPSAIAAFRLGLMLDPQNEFLRRNLEHVRTQVRYPRGGNGRPEQNAWPIWLPRLRPGAWLLIGVGGYMLGWAAAMMWWATRSNTWGVANLAGAVVALASGYGWLLLEQEHEKNRVTPIVVIAADDLPLLTGNGRSYSAHPDLPFVNAGMEARRIGSRGDWLHIQFASGAIGWIERAQAMEVELVRE